MDKGLGRRAVSYCHGTIMLIPDLYYLVPAPNKKASWRLASLLATELARAYKSDLSRWVCQPFTDEP